LVVSRPEAVLIVDADDQFVRELSRELRALGFPFVYRAASTGQALAMLHRVLPTLVLMGFDDRPASSRDVITRAEQLGASVALFSNRRVPLSSEPGILRKDRSELAGQALESLVLGLIDAAQRRSRSSIPVAERVA